MGLCNIFALRQSPKRKINSNFNHFLRLNFEQLLDRSASTHSALLTSFWFAGLVYDIIIEPIHQPPHRNNQSVLKHSINEHRRRLGVDDYRIRLTLATEQEIPLIMQYEAAD